MKSAGLGITLCLAAAAGWVPIGTARAGDQVQESILGTDPTAGGFALTKHGKAKIKPSTTAGDGGITFQLTLTGIDCPPNNDGGSLGKCGVSGSPQTNHVLDIGALFGGAELNHVAGVKYKIEKGTATFQATGKNKIGGAVFGPLVSAIFNKPLGFGYIEFRTPGTRPGDCDKVPLPAAACTGSLTTNCCTNGTLYALGGVLAGSDAGVTCTSDSQCGVTGICVASTCKLQPCDQDSDCVTKTGGTGGGAGSMECGGGCTCCDPSSDPTRAGQCTNTPNCNSCPSV